MPTVPAQARRARAGDKDNTNQEVAASESHSEKINNVTREISTVEKEESCQSVCLDCDR